MVTRHAKYLKCVLTGVRTALAREKAGDSEGFNCMKNQVKPVFHFARIVPKRTGEHAQIEKRFINHVLPGVFAYQNKKIVASQLFGVLRKY